MKLNWLLGSLFVAVSSVSHAGEIVGGSSILDTTGLGQLETWLGQGELTLTNIFTKAAGNTGIDFHAAVDGKGATFTLIRASLDGDNWEVIGGYNPLSWNSSNTYSYSANPSDWTGFIFNLTDSVKKSQTSGIQTLNYATGGPIFGQGFDIYTDGNLALGSSQLTSYASSPAEYYTSILTGAPSAGAAYSIGALEVFTVAGYTPSANVPEPATAALLSLGLLAFGATRRKKTPSV